MLNYSIAPRGCVGCSEGSVSIKSINFNIKMLEMPVTKRWNSKAIES